MIGLWPIKARHIMSWYEGEYFPRSDEIPNMDKERFLAAKDILKLELKWNSDVNFSTKWSEKQNIMWLTFSSETSVRSTKDKLI